MRKIIGGLILEIAWGFCLGFWVEFRSQEYEITISLGFIFGRLWITLGHGLLYKAFPSLFWGRNFGEWGREFGIMLERKHLNYSLFWYSDINKPSSWRSKYLFWK